MSKRQDWSKEERAVQAVQLAFDLSNDIQRTFRVAAAMQDMGTSDMVRKVLHLPYRKKRVRPRLTLTLKESDFEVLAERYGLDPSDRLAIRQKVSEELRAFSLSYLSESPPPDSR